MAETTPEIPGPGRLATARHTLQWLRSPVASARSIHQRYGPVFRVRAMGREIVGLLGPEANELVLLDRERVFSSEAGWGPLVGAFFGGGLMLRDFEEHRQHRQIVQGAFRSEGLRDYVVIMDREIGHEIGRWGDGLAREAKVRVHPALKRLTLRIASTVFLGEPLGDQAERLNEAFLWTVRAAGVGNLLRRAVPGSLHWRGLRSRAVLERHFREALPVRRARETPDLFSQLCHASTRAAADEAGGGMDHDADDDAAGAEPGAPLTDREIVDHMIFVLMAAHETATSTASTIVYELARHPEWQERCREEARAVAPDELRPGNLGRLALLGRVMKEALRMIAPVGAIARGALRDVEFEGFRVRAGSTVVVIPAFTHHMASYWTEPGVFDPDRFSPGRAEHAAHRFLYVPFGGGAHRCIGMHFAELEVKAIVVHLLRRYRWSTAPGYRMPVDNTSAPVPADGLPVHLERLA